MLNEKSIQITYLLFDRKIAPEYNKSQFRAEEYTLAFVPKSNETMFIATLRFIVMHDLVELEQLRFDIKCEGTFIFSQSKYELTEKDLYDCYTEKARHILAFIAANPASVPEIGYQFFSFELSDILSKARET